MHKGLEWWHLVVASAAISLAGGVPLALVSDQPKSIPVAVLSIFSLLWAGGFLLWMVVTVPLAILLHWKERFLGNRAAEARRAREDREAKAAKELARGKEQMGKPGLLEVFFVCMALIGVAVVVATPFVIAVLAPPVRDPSTGEEYQLLSQVLSRFLFFEAEEARDIWTLWLYLSTGLAVALACALWSLVNVLEKKRQGKSEQVDGIETGSDDSPADPKSVVESTHQSESMTRHQGQPESGVKHVRAEPTERWVRCPRCGMQYVNRPGGCPGCSSTT